MQTKQPRVVFTLLVLLGINTMNFYDRQVLGAIGQPLKKAWNLSDTQLGLLGTAFIVLYAFVGVPLGRWSDFGPRTKILAGGAALWSLLTAASGVAWNTWSLFVMRLGVGVGEASCAPAANSLIGDLFPPHRRARAISFFMLGLPLGLGLSSVVSGLVAGEAERLLGEGWGWRAAFWVAGVPGLMLAILSLWIPEPSRGAAEHQQIGGARRPGSPILLVLSLPTMWWISISGALHNFNMYALGGFLPSFLQRYHGLDVKWAGVVSGVVYGCGGLGIFLGGWACDWISKRRISGRLEVSALALLVFVPCMFMGLNQPPGSYWRFMVWLLPGCLLSYAYYSGVYATVADITEPALRGTAMAVYFFAQYLLGAALGPYLTGWVSDMFARRAALAEGSEGISEHAQAIGLHQAMYMLPVLGIALVIVLFIASLTVKRDYEKLQNWMAANTPGEDKSGSSLEDLQSAAAES